MSATFRSGTPADSYPAFKILRLSFWDLVRRQTDETVPAAADVPESDHLKAYERFAPLFEFLAGHAYAWWVAENEAGGLVGYARSLLMDGVLELTEFFVLPGQQMGGVGRELLTRAFPESGPDFQRRLIEATLDVRAQARYVKTGLHPRVPIYNLMSTELVLQNVPTVETDLQCEAVTAPQSEMHDIDRAILEYVRRVEHEWLAVNRQLYLARRAGQVVGYFYMGKEVGAFDGPMALLDNADFPALLNFWERLAIARGGDFGLEIPTTNAPALHYLMGRGYRLEKIITVMMTDSAWGDFSRYILTSPPLFI